MVNHNASTIGSFYAVMAYGLWGMTPIYFKWIDFINPFEIITHRIFWSLILLISIITLMSNWQKVKTVLHSRRQIVLIFSTALLIGINWSIFIWAISADLMLDASLGYYINPLVNVLLGFVFLAERLRRWQWLAVCLALIAVCIQVILLGYLPWVSLTLALSFGTYGLLHKKIHADSLVSLFLEAVILLPIISLVFLGITYNQVSETSYSTELWLLLTLSGPMTIIPLLFFASAAKRLRLSTLGFFQYIAPSMIFLLAVLIYQEPLQLEKLVTFILIWLALAIYSIDTFLYSKTNKLPNNPSLTSQEKT